jgi:tetratricopeptide (TPR) repeat protein
MNRGVKSLLLVGSLAAASCATAPEQVKIRPIADPGSKMRSGNDVLADAKGQFALGNTGLALEGFRRASREQPDNAEAFVGMAACYDIMGRYDLAQTNYQAALALQPRNPTLLNAFAASLERQGRADAAREVREEVAGLNSAAAALERTPAESDEPVVRAAQAIVVPTVPLTKAVQVAPTTALVASAPVVTVALPPAQPVAMVAMGPPQPVASLTPPPHAVAPIAVPEARIAEMLARANATVDAGPRLERLSLGEVALVTGVSAWRGQVVASSKQSVTVRWIPLNVASARPNIRLLNAARRQGLAARSREYLLGRGWRKIEIGDYKDIREESVVLYPAARPALGRSLAAQFGFRARAVDKGDVFVVLLGRDAARPVQQRG